MYFQSFARLAASLGVLLILTTASYPISLSDPNSPYSYFSGPQQNNAGSLTALPAIPGLYDLSFRKYRGNGVMEPVSSLPARGGPLVLFAHIEDTAGNPAQSGTVTFEYCGAYEPKETCDAGLARWTRLNRVSIGSCSCPSCGGLPGFDPGPGNACLFVFDTGGSPGVDGFRFNYAGRKGFVDSGMSDALNFTWTEGGAPSPTPTPPPTPTPTPGERTNFALASNGGVASASSEYSSDFPIAGANNGDRKGLIWGAGGGWNDNTSGVYPDFLQIDFNGTKTIDEIDVLTLQDNFMNPSEPELNMTFSQYGITHFDVQYWNGSDWVTVPGGSITGNNKVWSQISFSAVTTDKIRIQVNNSLANYSRIVEIEAYGSA